MSGRHPVTARTRRRAGLALKAQRGRWRPPSHVPTGSWPPSGAVHYRALLRYAEREGHARVPRPHREDGLNLGRWVHNARSRYKQGRLTIEQVSCLQRVRGWAWQVAPTPAVYDAGHMVRLVRQYADRHGHARMPLGYRAGGVRVGAWVSRRRQDYRRGRLRPSVVRLLESIRGWSWQTCPTRYWRPFTAMLRLLRRYARREGHGRVPQRHLEDGLPLGRWVAAQRRAYRNKTLPESRRHLLDGMPGWSWRLARPRRLPLGRVLDALDRFVRRRATRASPPATRKAACRWAIG